MLLEATDISYRYGTSPWLFKDFSLTVKSGEIIGLCGASGCGKTTLSRILTGYLKPLSGKVLLNHQPLSVKAYNPVQLVYQHPEKAVNSRWKMEKILSEGWQPSEALLDMLGIEKAWLNRWPNELSGGELQRFCVARALGPQTKFLIADEMTTMLDAITQAQIWQAVLEIAKHQNMGIIVVSHDHHLIQRLCTRIINF